MLRKSRKMLKNRLGFTLVEVIVVAVIVAVLAAVAIPLYLGYVKDSRINSAANAAGSVASFCGACQSAGGALSSTGTVTGMVSCTGTGVTTTSIQIPADIIINITARSGNTPGSVTGRHIHSDASDSTSTKSYSF